MGVAVLDLRQVPEHKVPRPAVVPLRLLLVEVDRHNFDARLEDQGTAGQVLGGAPYRRHTFHKRHLGDLCNIVMQTKRHFMKNKRFIIDQQF